MSAPFAFRRPDRRWRPPWWSVLCALVAFFLIRQSLWERYAAPELPQYQIARLIAVNGFLDAGAQQHSQAWRWWTGTDRHFLWSQIELACLQVGPEQLNRENRLSWAMAARHFGHPERAREILSSLPTEETESFPGAVIMAAARGEPLESWVGFAATAREALDADTATWATLVALQSTTDSPSLRERCRGRLEWSGNHLFVRNAHSCRVYLLVFACASVVAGVSLASLVRRRRLAPPDPVAAPPPWGTHARLLCTWHPSRLLFYFVIGSMLSLLLSQTPFLVPLPFEAQLWASYLLFALVAPWVMIRALAPGCHAMRRVFGMRSRDASHDPLPLFRYASVALALSLVGSWIVYEIGRSWGDPLVLDILDFGLLDRPPGFSAHLIYGIVVAPVVEEILFRGFLFTGLAGKWGIPTAALASSLLFSLAHDYTPFGLAAIFLFGLILCWATVRSRSLWPSTLAHMAFNWLSLHHLMARFSF